MTEINDQHTGEHRVPGTGRMAALPAQLTRLVGREREVGDLLALLADARLLTLTGAGGSGKTRLALVLASRAAPSFDDGVAWVELAPLVDPDQLPGHVAAALGVRQEGTRSAEEGIVAALRGRRMLLVLDNCEHLVDAGARLAELLLRRSPRLSILATSRAPLGLTGERSWLVPVLSLPDAAGPATAERVAASTAVQLFVERARDVAPSFALTDANAPAVGRICRRVDGLPLAIELAAARVRMLAPEQIAARLDEGFRVLDGGIRGSLPRHRTLRAAMDWSYELLDERERLLLQRLSVFAGDWPLEAAESVAAGGAVEASAVLDLLGALVDESLVVVRESAGTARCQLLETIRQYAAERLEAEGDAAVYRARHAAFYAGIVAESEPDFVTAHRPAAVARVSRELDDVRAALAWTREHDPAMHVHLAGMLTWPWYSLGLWAEGRRWLDGAIALSASDPSVPPRDRAAVLFGAGAIASLQAKPAEARALLTEGLAIAREAGDQRLAAYISNYLGMAYIQHGLPEGEPFARDALAWFRAAGDPYGHRLALLLLATLHLARGQLEAALGAAEDAVVVARRFGLDRELGISLQVLGGVVLQTGDLERAGSIIRESLARLENDPQPQFTGRGLELLGVIACRRGEPLLGARYFGAAAAERELVSADLWRLDRERLAPIVEAARTAVGAEAFDAAMAEGGGMGRAGVLALAAKESPEPAAPEPEAAAHTVQGEGLRARVALRVRAFGALEIELDGAPLASDAWRSAKPRELLLYLLSHPEGRTREQLGLVFWPEASAAQVKNNFHVTLHHLRKVLRRPEWIVFERDRYRVNEALGVELDAIAFRRDATAALRALPSRAAPLAEREAALERLRSALALYRGDFLEDVAVGEWHFELRDELRRLWTTGMRAAGELMVRMERFREAADVYRQLVLREEFLEEAHRQLMTCLARAGDRAQALRVYERLASTLRDELEAEPEPDTTALFDRLRRAEVV